MSRSDTELLEGIRLDDQSAWNDFVKRHTAFVWATARAQSLDQQSATDVVQEVWIELLKYRDRIDNPAAIRGWLATTTRRLAIRAAMKQRKNVPSESIETVADLTSTDGEARVDDLDALRTLARAFAQLSPACRELLEALFSPEERSYDDIAGSLGRPIGSLGPQRARCLKQLKALHAAQRGARSGSPASQEVRNAN